MKILITENKMKPILHNLLNKLFDGFDDIYYDWANFNCGMGECCDPYAIGFTLPKSQYDEYLFKLIDGDNWEPFGRNYPDEISDELPEVCHEYPDVKNTNFNIIIFNYDDAKEIENFLGPKENWSSSLLDIINEKFGCEATKILITHNF